MVTIETKPLSVNMAWRGRRFRTDAYKNYEVGVMRMLPKIKTPEPPYKVYYEFGFSSKGSDIDNPIKCFQDILVKKYKFRDQDIYELHVVKKIVPKGGEYIKFTITQLKPE
jgi:Holliday junction resolvase RusA-like endonuclease